MPSIDLARLQKANDARSAKEKHVRFSGVYFKSPPPTSEMIAVKAWTATIRVVESLTGMSTM